MQYFFYRIYTILIQNLYDQYDKRFYTMGDSDKLMDVESGQKEACEEELPSDDDEGGKVNLKSNYSSYINIVLLWSWHLIVLILLLI